MRGRSYGRSHRSRLHRQSRKVRCSYGSAPLLNEAKVFHGIVRADGEYKITAKGAQGGDGASKVGGSGAVVSATFANELDRFFPVDNKNKKSVKSYRYSKNGKGSVTNNGMICGLHVEIKSSVHWVSR